MKKKVKELENESEKEHTATNGEERHGKIKT